MQGLDADVACLTELENPGCAQGTLPEALQDLVTGLNTPPFYPSGTYDSVHVPVTIGTDAIKVGLVYKTAKVRPVCNTAVLTSAFDPRFIETRNRPALTQTFEEIATGQRFTMICNHFKSKGSDCLPDDPDLNDGQGNCNLTRTKAAQALVSWATSNPTGCVEPRVLIAGDLNSYAKENPITALTSGGFQLLGSEGTNGYSFQFQGQSGALDYLLASAALVSQVTEAVRWHNNADEPVILDYNTEFKNEDLFDPSTPFRVADHDPTLVGLSLSVPSAVPAIGGKWLAALLGATLLAAGCALLAGGRSRRSQQRLATPASEWLLGTRPRGHRRSCRMSAG
jgi:predicted extracellular nuclease